MSLVPIDNSSAEFVYPPDPFPGHLMKDNEATIGVPIYDNNTQYEVCGFCRHNKAAKLNYAILVFTGEVAEPIHATLYLVQKTLNRTVALHHWTITPDKESHRITHEVGYHMEDPHKYLIHFHLKDGQVIEGYIHVCLSTD